MDARKTDALYKIEGFGKFPLILSRKAHHDVGCQGAVGEMLAKQGGYRGIFIRCVSPVHPCEGVGTAALQRKVKLGAELLSEESRLTVSGVIRSGSSEPIMNRRIPENEQDSSAASQTDPPHS